LSLPNGTTIWNQLLDITDLDENTTLLTWLKTSADYFFCIEKHMKCDLIILKKTKLFQHTLLYDNRFLESHQPNSFLLQCFILDNEGCLLEKKTDVDFLPKLHCKQKEKSLLQLLNLNEPEPHFNTCQDALHFLKLHNVKSHVFYTIRHSKTVYFEEEWTQKHLNYQNFERIEIEAFTTSNYTLGFQKRIIKPMLSFQEMKKIELQKKAQQTKTDEEEINPFQQNNSIAVNVKLTGLNQAFNLGCITLTEFKNLSARLSNTSMCLWIELDEKNNARYVTYKDWQKTFHKEVNQTAESWKIVFDVMFERRKLFVEEKTKMLEPLFEKLQKFNDKKTNPWKTCIRMLKSCIQNTKVIVYSENDSILHSLKTFFCNYVDEMKKKKFRGIKLQANSKNDLVMFQISEMTFLNYGSYLKMDTSKMDAAFSPPFLSSKTKLLNDHKMKYNNKSTLKHCKERGKVMSNFLFKNWQNFGEYVMKRFQIDLFSMPYVSLSKLSFICVWHKYALKAGIFHQGLEQSKMYQENVLRKFSTGGFSYSCQDKINCGEPIHSDLTQPLAKTIRELDIQSSYGYAASTMNVPTGFCSGFINEGSKYLQKIDIKSRFFSFEFLSVYYTLWKLEKKCHIQTVYSNYHQHGIISVAHHPIDLVVITTEGKIKLFAFDGAWVHGCKQGCPNLKSYVGKKSRQEVEHQTELRDQIILEWCQQINQIEPGFVEYTIISDCHHPEYFPRTLKQFFENEPQLKPLIEGYIQKNELSQDEILMSSDKLTFIAVLDGHVPKNSNFVQQHPLFIQNEEKKWNRCSATNPDKQGMLMTKDYLKYVIKEHNFQVTNIHQVFFYKKCNILPSIFKELIETRASSMTSPEEKTLLKNIVNFSAGFFGFNEKKHQIISNCRLVTSFPLKCKFNYVNTFQQLVGTVGTKEIWFLKTTRSNLKQKIMTKSALPIYVCITEFGKQRLSEMFTLFEKYLVPEKYRLCYSNVDNTLIVLSTDTLEEAVIPQYKKKFLAKQTEFFQENTPGHLKEEFVMTSDLEWKFVSGMTQNYAIITKDVAIGIHKNSAMNHVSTLQSYQAACNMLDNFKFSIPQIRRTCKLAHMIQTSRNFSFK